MAVVQQQQVAVRHEIEQVVKALRRGGVTATFLKGAGYVVAGLPMSRGRVFSDIDILVPKARIDQVEGLLRTHGWQFGELSRYDQRYYRQWMHELPPMTHVRRGSVVDVHHTLLPETARLKVDAGALIEGIVPIDQKTGGRTCCNRSTCCCTVQHTCSTKVSSTTRCVTCSTWMPCSVTSGRAKTATPSGAIWCRGLRRWGLRGHCSTHCAIRRCC